MIDQVDDLKFTEGAKLIFDSIDTGTTTNVLIKSATGEVQERAFSTFTTNRNIDGGSASARFTPPPFDGGGA